METVQAEFKLESVDEILGCDQSNETSSAVSHGTIYLVHNSNFGAKIIFKRSLT